MGIGKIYAPHALRLSYSSLRARKRIQSNSSPSSYDGINKIEQELLERNCIYLKNNLKTSEESLSLILCDPRMRGVEVEERVRMLREVTGITRTTLKKYIAKYPIMVVDMFTGRVKSSKSVVMKILRLSESEYVRSVEKIQRQTNNRPGTLFRGSFPLIVAILEDPVYLGLNRNQVKTVFEYYPTVFTLDEAFLRKRFKFLLSRKIGYSVSELRSMLLTNGRALFYDEDRYLEKMKFFVKKLGLTTREFCKLTSQEPRLITAALNDTIVAKTHHLMSDDAWGLNHTEIKPLLLTSPTILTTPVNTTASLFLYLTNDLNMTPQQARYSVMKYPGFLKTNSKSLARKLQFLVAVEAVMKTCLLEDAYLFNVNEGGPLARIYAGIGDVGSVFANEEEVIIALEQVLVQVAALLLAQCGIVFTFSDARISERLLLTARTKYLGRRAQHFYDKDKDLETTVLMHESDANEEDSGEDIEKILAQVAGHFHNSNGYVDGRSVSLTSPPWPEFDIDTFDNESKGRIEQENTSFYRHLARALVEVVGARACALVILEAAQSRSTITDRGVLTRMLPIPPQQAVTYAKEKFEKWLKSQI
jgi:hypothetical protein